MKKQKSSSIAGSISLRILGIAGIIGVFYLVSQEFDWMKIGFIDVKAALLVFLTPWLVLLTFRKDSISVRLLMSRVREGQKFDNRALVSEMTSLTDQISRGGIRSDLAKISEEHPDSFVRYCAGAYNSKFETKELATLMQQKMEREDESWQALNLVFGFLAKMAPYFGMLATVIGMISLLHNMQDYSKISASMALALQGTLYGLISFTLVFAPIQKWVNGFREWLYRRNMMVAHWFVMLSEERDPSVIRANLENESNLG
jgi:flagellar motor component MotA